MDAQLNPARIIEVGTAFWASKVLLTATSLGLFTRLAQGPMSADEIGAALDLHPRGRRDFLDALVALKFLDRDGDGDDARYRNSPDAAAFLDKSKGSYVGGILEMLDGRLFGFWNELGEALRTGEPQNESKGGGDSMFATLYADPGRLKLFLEGMSGFQTGNFMLLAHAVDFGRYRTLTDMGGALALLSRVVARVHPHMHCTSVDLAPVRPLAQAAVDADGLSDRVTVLAGDFFAEPIPPADVVTMGNILHDWDLATKKMLIAKAYEALPEGGAFIAVELVIDDARRENAAGLLMSLNMLIETEGGFDYSFADFKSWCGEAGFSRFDLIPLAGPACAAVAWK